MVPPELVRTLPDNLSIAKLLAEELGTEWTKFYANLPAHDRFILNHDWNFWARPPQLAPAGYWNTWVIMAGRGFGKTRPGAEQVIRWAIELGQEYGAGHIALVGKDPEDIRKVMIEGESGILACSPPWFRPKWEPTKKQMLWPNNVLASVYSSEEPDQLRGPQHHKAWGDEPCKWRYAQETWDMLQFGLRLGIHPQALLTTTPRPIKMLIDILSDTDTTVTGGATDQNADNLSDIFMKAVYRRYGGTRLGRQELLGQLLTDTPGALWTQAMIDDLRVKVQDAPEMQMMVVAIDPQAAKPTDDPELQENLAETGIVVTGKGVDGHHYVLHDFSDHYSPDGWGKKACVHYETLQCEKIIGEINNGGAMVEYVIKTCARDLGYDVLFKMVHASRGKRTRAEPVAALYEQKRGHHVGDFPELENQMTTWVPGNDSPDRMDAMVWGATECMLLTPDDLVM